MEKETRCGMYEATKPCSNCPYRTDAPLRLWHKSEFKKLLEIENADIQQGDIGATYMCHKNNGSVCVGWLMKQDDAGLPSIALRISLSKHHVTRDYLDNLSSPAPLYKNVKEMIQANFPELLK